jgi:hypothetical protein
MLVLLLIRRGCLKGAHDTAMVKVRLGLGALGLNESARPQRIAQRADTPSHSPNVDPMASYFADNVVNNGSICVLPERLVGFIARLPESVS